MKSIYAWILVALLTLVYSFIFYAFKDIELTTRAPLAAGISLSFSMLLIKVFAKHNK